MIKSKELRRKLINDQIAEWEKYWQSVADMTEDAKIPHAEEMIPNFMMIREDQIRATINAKVEIKMQYERQGAVVTEKMDEEIFKLRCEKIALEKVTMEYADYFIKPTPQPEVTEPELKSDGQPTETEVKKD